jgi:alpha-L-fucosidase
MVFQPKPGTPDFDRYIAFMKGQLRELVVDYGADIVQFDGEWDKTWNHERGSDLYKYVRDLNPEALVSSRVDVGRYHLDPKTKQWDFGKYAGDFDERERMVDWIVGEESRVFGKSSNPWQAWVTIDQAQWAWNATPRLLKADEIIVDLVKTVGDGGNYLINLGPRADGSFEPEQAEMIRHVGRWLKANGDGIYGTRAGPYSKEGAYTSTVKGKMVTLFILDPKLTQVSLAAGQRTPKKAIDSDGKPLQLKRGEGTMTISLPQDSSGPIRVIRFR